MISWAALAGSSGTTSKAPTRPTLAAGSILTTIFELPLTVWNIIPRVINTGSKRSISFQVLSVGCRLAVACVVVKKVVNELASLATNWDSTSPRQRLRKTKVALTLRNVIRAIGKIIIQASIIVDVIFS
jgi:hypothetical protein